MTHELSGPQLLLAFFILLIIASLTGYYADKKGRSSTVWFILTLLFGPLVAVVLFILPSLKEEKTPLPKDYDAWNKTNSTGEREAHSSLTVGEKQQAQQLTYLKDDKLWYYLDTEHHQYGPVSLIGLRELWNTGKVGLTTYVWSEGMADWKKVEELPELRQALASMKTML